MITLQGSDYFQSQKSLSSFNIYLEKIFSADTDVLNAIKNLNMTVKYLDDLSQINILNKNDVLITEVFEQLAVKKPCFKLLGRPALLELASRPTGLRGVNRYRYCNALVGAIVSITGIKKKDEMARLLCLIRWMGGSFRENINHKTTFLVSDYACSDKSQYAFLHEIPVVSTTWLYEAWIRRSEMGFSAANLSFVSEHKLKPFHGAKIGFIGFTEEERTHMIDVLLQNGGTPVDKNDAWCTHLVTKEVYSCTSYTYGEWNPKTASCLQGVLTPKKLIEILEKDHLQSMSPYGRNRGLTSTHNLTNGNELLENEEKYLVDHENDERFMHSNLLSACMDQTDLNLVVNDSLKDYTPLVKKTHAEVVKESWFWTSVQYQSCALIKEYYLTNISIFLSNVFNTSTSALSPTFTINSSTQTRKRKRQTDSNGDMQKFNQTAIDEKTSPFSCSDLSKLNCSIVKNSAESPSFLNVNNSPDSSTFTCTKDASKVILKDKPFSPRYQVFSELLQTETNYVGILSTIISVYQKPLEEINGKKGCNLLDNTEIKIIFGNVLPIYEIHCKILEEFKYLAETWEENSSIGSVLLNYSNDLIKAYPPFVNYFEKTREMLLQCDQMKPRFHAFLKVGQTKPECCRQSLLDLLIRPIQRLPSISLLLNDILKHTDFSNPDHKALKLALLDITEVMTHINEDKRKTEGQIVLFDIFNEIDNCPAHLISSHRSFITKCDVIELGDNVSGRGDNLTIFLFSDMIEFSKKRRLFDMKSPKELNSSLHKINGAKLYKHVKLIPLNSIKQVINIKETDDCHDAFSLLIIDKNDFQEYLYTFTITGNGNFNTVNKQTFLNNLSKQVANTNCSGNILISLDCQQLDIDTSAISTGTLRKAFKFANKTRIRFGRAISFNKTPNKLKQAVSTMISPMMNLSNNDIGAKKSLTPCSLLSNLDLKSCNNHSFSFLNEQNTKSNSLKKIKKTVKRNSKSHVTR